MSKRKRNPLETPVVVKAGPLFHVLMAVLEWEQDHEAMLDHVRREGTWSCDEQEKADPSEVLELSDRVEIVRASKAWLAGQIPPAVWRFIERTMVCDDETVAAPPLSGQAAKDLTDLLGEL